MNHQWDENDRCKICGAKDWMDNAQCAPEIPTPRVWSCTTVFLPKGILAYAQAMRGLARNLEQELTAAIKRQWNPENDGDMVFDKVLGWLHVNTQEYILKIEKERDELAVQLEQEKQAYASADSNFDAAVMQKLKAETDLRASQEREKRLREALERICAGEASVTGLRPEFIGHAQKIAAAALADTQPTSTKPATHANVEWDGCSEGGLWRCADCRKAYCAPPWTRDKVMLQPCKNPTTSTNAHPRPENPVAGL